MADENEKPQESTPEDIARETKAVKMLITYHPDTQEIQVQNVQNLTRPLAMYVTSRVFKTYENDETALAVVKHLSGLVEQSKQGKQGKLWVPGSKK